MICVYYTYEEVRFKELSHVIVGANKSEIYFQLYFLPGNSGSGDVYVAVLKRMPFSLENLSFCPYLLQLIR